MLGKYRVENILYCSIDQNFNINKKCIHINKNIIIFCMNIFNTLKNVTYLKLKKGESLILTMIFVNNKKVPTLVFRENEFVLTITSQYFSR